MTEAGVCVNSGEAFDGLSTAECKKAIVDKLQALRCPD